MARLSDLVLDSKLETYFPSGSTFKTVHIYHDRDLSSRQRVTTRAEHWQREKKIGGGGFGTVWRERCTEGGNGFEVRAVKQMEVHRQVDYNRELEAIAKFSHPKYERCFVKSFGWYEDPKNVFIAMEYFELGDLQTYLHKRQPLPEGEVREIVFQVLEGLDMMHRNHFAHRDLKPNNILLKSCPPNGWWVKIADFGISKRIEDGLGRSTTLKGTDGYIAPEVLGIPAHGTTYAVDPYAADMWASGEITFRLLTKCPTFSNMGLLVKYMADPSVFPSGLLLNARISELGVDFIRSLMHPVPKSRITAKEALHHRWMDQLLPNNHFSATLAYRGTPTESATCSVTEEYASWNTITSPEEPVTVTRTKAEEYKLPPLQTDGDKPVPNTTSYPSDGWNTTSTDGDMVASVSEDKTARLWDPDAATGAVCRTLKGHTDTIEGIAFSPNGKLLASGSWDGTVRLWDLATGAVCHTLHGHTKCVKAVAFSPDGKLLASGSDSGSVRLWKPATVTVCRKLNGHRDCCVYDLAFSPNGKLLASASEDERVRLWDPATGTLCCKLFCHSEVLGVAFSPNGKLLACANSRMSLSYGKTVTLWDPATGAMHCMLRGHTGSVWAVAFSPDGKLLASGSEDKTVRLWDLATGAVCHTLHGHTKCVKAVAFSPDGKLLASRSDDGIVRLWDPATGAVCRTLKSHAGVRAIAFSPDGKLLAYGSDNTVRLWGLTV